jgi:Tol biopolymer transport system component
MHTGIQVFEGSPVRFLWILDQLRNETKMLFELIKDLPPSPGWTCTGGASGKDGTLTLEQAMLIDNLIGRIAFSSSFGYGNVEIHVMNADGSDLTNITNNSAWDWTPSWSPDGGKITFSSDRDGKLEIYVMNADGSDLTRLTNNSAWDYRPAWSPDGAKIAFQSHSDGNSEIYVMNTDGSDQTRLTNNGLEDNNPSWSPE